ncbi:MAG: hypothetical protein AB7G07_17080 [Bauldia sp.]
MHEVAHTARLGRGPLIACAIVYAALLATEEFAISRMDAYLSIQSIEQAEIIAISMNAIFDFLRLATIGVATWLLARAVSRQSPAMTTGFPNLPFWVAAALTTSSLVLGSNLTGYIAQFSPLATDAETYRSLLLAQIYVNILVYYVFVRVVLGAAIARMSPPGLMSAWRATGTGESIAIFLVVVAAQLAMEDVVVSMLGYAPFVAPLWFIPDESAPHRYLLGQGTRIVAESLAVPVFRCCGSG